MYLPKGKSHDELVAEWSQWKSDPGCTYDTLVEIDASELEPQVTWGTSPGMVTSITGTTPVLALIEDPDLRLSTQKALKYMGLEEGMPMTDIRPNTVYIGSCTNGRIEDMRAAAKVAKGYKVASNIERALMVPGSGEVKRAAEAEGLDKIFKEAGFEWREPGCSMCLAMNADILKPGDRCASTSNRNFEGRQGKGGLTHLVSPEMAAAAAIMGHFVDVRDWEYK